MLRRDKHTGRVGAQAENSALRSVERAQLRRSIRIRVSNVEPAYDLIAEPVVRHRTMRRRVFALGVRPSARGHSSVAAQRAHENLQQVFPEASEFPTIFKELRQRGTLAPLNIPAASVLS
jgi:hypothetical protein